MSVHGSSFQLHITWYLCTQLSWLQSSWLSHTSITSTLKTAISRMVGQPAANCPKDCQTTTPFFAAEATAISLSLNYCQHMGPVHHDVVVYSDSMSCLQAIEGEDENLFICQIMNLLWSLIEWQGHTCSFLLGPKPRWHWRKWEWTNCERDPRPRYRPTIQIWNHWSTPTFRSWFKPSGM